MPTLEVNGLSAGYGEIRVLENLTFRAEAGAILAVLGRNGVGKTTLLATLMGLTRRYSGAIKFGDNDVSLLSTSQRAWQGLGYVPQTRDIFQSLTVQENLFVGLKHRSAKEVSEAYELFPRLYERKGHLGGQLSGGEQQMLSVARTLLGEPAVLLLDEPLEGLAPVICDELMASLHSLTARHSMTVILVEQQIERALDFAEHALILERGSLVWMGSAKELRNNRPIVDQYLGVGVY